MEIRIPARVTKNVTEVTKNVSQVGDTPSELKINEAPYGRKTDGTPKAKPGRLEKPVRGPKPEVRQYIMQSGPDGSRPTKHIREYARPYTEEMLDLMVEMARDREAPPAVRLDAMKSVIDRTYGKPKETLELEAPAEGLRKVLNDISSEDLTDLVRALRNPPIDVTPTKPATEQKTKP